MFVFWLILFFFLCSALGSRGGVRYKHLRGLQLRSLWQVRRQLKRWQDVHQTFVWGRFRLPLRLASQHFLVAGTVGSGKTLLLRLLMQSVFPWIGRGEGHRALIYDGKGDLLPILLGMKQDYQTVFTFCPFHPQGVRWDIAADVTDDASANQIARLLFPLQGSESQPFFTASCQNLAARAMQVLNDRAAGQWRLSHLLFILRSPERIQSTLALTEAGRDTLTQFIHSGETWANISAVISNRINDYEIVAGLWDNASQAVSLKEWNESESIWVLRRHHECSDVVDAINRVLFAVAKRRLLSKPETPSRRTWVIMDELASLGGKEASKELNLLMEQGRSRNICVALGFQNIASLRDQLGQYGADRLMALCSTKALLRFEDHSSAQWASEFFGKQEVRVETVSVSHTGGSSPHSSTTTSYQDKERWTVMPSEFLATPTAGPEHGVTGYFLIPEGDTPLAFQDTLPKKWLFGQGTLAPIADWDAGERPAEQQRTKITAKELHQLLHGSTSFAPAQTGISPTDNSAALPQSGLQNPIPPTALQSNALADPQVPPAITPSLPSRYVAATSAPPAPFSAATTAMAPHQISNNPLFSCPRETPATSASNLPVTASVNASVASPMNLVVPSPGSAGSASMMLASSASMPNDGPSLTGQLSSGPQGPATMKTRRKARHSIPTGVAATTIAPDDSSTPPSVKPTGGTPSIWSIKRPS